MVCLLRIRNLLEVVVQSFKKFGFQQFKKLPCLAMQCNKIIRCLESTTLYLFLLHLRSNPIKISFQLMYLLSFFLRNFLFLGRKYNRVQFDLMFSTLCWPIIIPQRVNDSITKTTLRGFYFITVRVNNVATLL